MLWPKFGRVRLILSDVGGVGDEVEVRGRGLGRGQYRRLTDASCGVAVTTVLLCGRDGGER